MINLKSLIMTRRIVLLLFILISIIACGPLDKHKAPHEIHVAIQPYGDFPKEWAQQVAQNIRKVYGFKAEVLPGRSLPKTAFVQTKSPRYRGDSLLRDLKKHKPKSFDYIIGLTVKDISTTKYENFKLKIVKKPESKYQDWGVFGLGYRPGVASIISTYRLKTPSEKRFKDRLNKISMHELGHNQGLDHCPSHNCVMEDAAETIRTIDRVQLKLCPECQKKLE
jgi:archaemetzincin